MRHLAVILLVLLGGPLSAQARYVTAKAKAGDGALTLLARYRIDQYPCNLDEFYKINKLKKNVGLLVNVTYKLPIQIYKFNKKTIMGSVGIQDKALALQIDEYNHKMHARGIKPERYQADLELWVPHGMLHCSPTVKLADPVEREYAYLGKKHRKISLKDHKLSGAVYYLIPGHGGPDPGAVGKVGRHVLCEDEYAYDVTLRLAENLLEHGATVYLMVQDPNDGIRDEQYLQCDEDEKHYGGKAIPINQKARLQKRADLVNELYEKHRQKGAYQRVIEIHVDSRAKHERIDLFFYYAPGSTDGKATAKALYKVMLERYRENRKNGQYEGAVIPRDLFTLINCLPPTVFIELGNIQNYNDQKRLTGVEHRQAIADWLTEGLLLDY